MYAREQLVAFIRESNFIEGITREPSDAEISEFERFMQLPVITIEDLESFVRVYQPNAQLRDKYDMNVRVGKPPWRYIPPFGNPHMRRWLQEILDSTVTAHMLHKNYECLHPFTDGNGRSGRALWAWKHRDISRGFLMTYYFQSLHEHKYEVNHEEE